MLPRIGITCWTKPDTRGLYALVNRYYSESVLGAGGLPFLLPVTKSLGLAAEIVQALDGLVLTGGADVNPTRYGQERHPSVTDVDDERDAWELALFHAAREAHLPVFAICRGSQLVNVAQGGTLFQDVPSQKPSSTHHPGAEGAMNVLTHGIRLTPEASRFRDLWGTTEGRVNSFHHQAVDRLGNGLTVTAWSEDGLVEAFEGTGDDYLVAVQFHPEALAAEHPEHLALFQGFVRACQNPRPASKRD